MSLASRVDDELAGLALNADWGERGVSFFENDSCRGCLHNFRHEPTPVRPRPEAISRADDDRSHWCRTLTFARA